MGRIQRPLYLAGKTLCRSVSRIHHEMGDVRLAHAHDARLLFFLFVLKYKSKKGH